MKNIYFLSIIFLLPVLGLTQKVISRKQLFKEDTALAITLKTDLRKLQAEKESPQYIPVEISIQRPDSIGLVTDVARIKQRGNNRRETCNLASLMIDFSEKGKKSSFSNLDEIKLVTPCFVGIESEQWMFKEFLIYKMYNLFTDKSFKVRLLNIRFEDSRGKIKTYSRYGFAIEPVKDLADRNDCVEETRKHNTESTIREQMTLVAIFQFMVGNTDWAVPNFHNIKLIKSKDSVAYPIPFVVPYDFDYAGAVNTSYSIPYEGLPIERTTDRYYLGFKRNLEEINDVLIAFRKNEESILNLIENFSLLNPYNKKEMINFIKSFYKIIDKEKDVKDIFINNARIR